MWSPGTKWEVKSKSQSVRMDEKRQEGEEWVGCLETKVFRKQKLHRQAAVGKGVAASTRSHIHNRERSCGRGTHVYARKKGAKK